MPFLILATFIATIQAANFEGTYKGSRTIVLPFTMTATFDDTTMNFKLENGSADIECSNEDYTRSGSTVTPTNIELEGDCMHDVLKDNGDITYDADEETVTVTVTLFGEFVLSKVKLFGPKNVGKSTISRLQGVAV